jgi:hypothetical protein
MESSLLRPVEEQLESANSLPAGPADRFQQALPMCWDGVPKRVQEGLD